jgi:hypothetical protein
MIEQDVARGAGELLGREIKQGTWVSTGRPMPDWDACDAVGAAWREFGLTGEAPDSWIPGGVHTLGLLVHAYRRRYAELHGVLFLSDRYIEERRAAAADRELMLVELRGLVQVFRDRSRATRGTGEAGNAAAVAWVEAAADLSVVLTVREQRRPGDSPVKDKVAES